MLTGVDFGAAPTNLTTPLRVAVPAVVLLTEGEGPAFTALRPLMQINVVRASIGMSLFVIFVVFVVIQTTFLPRARGTRFFFFVNFAITDDTEEEKWSCHPAVNFKSLLCCVFVTRDFREIDNFWGRQFAEGLAV